MKSVIFLLNLYADSFQFFSQHINQSADVLCNFLWQIKIGGKSFGFNAEQGKFFYEKHKVFLYQEDFEKFTNGLNDAITFIETGEAPPELEVQAEETTTVEEKSEVVDVNFEDLGKEDA